jgi:hypothetical protein
VRWILAVLLVGCGRLDFANHAIDGARGPLDSSDALDGHDEDGDGIPDSIDPCPWVAGDNADSDGDGVGDACDPDPGLPNSIQVFSTLQPDARPLLADTTDYTQEADDLRFAGITDGGAIPYPIANSVVEIGFTISALLGSGQHQLAMGGQKGVPYYFVELDDNTPTKDVAVVVYDGSTYMNLAAQNTAGMHPGVGLIRLTADATGQTYTIDAGWVGEMYHAQASVAGYAGAPALQFSVNGLDVQFRYLAIVKRP